MRPSPRPAFNHLASLHGKPTKMMMTAPRGTMPGPLARVCHRCGYTAEDSAQTTCPRDGLHLVAQAEHLKAPRDIFLGTTIGAKYPILGTLGHGGMGAVYRSIQPLVDREVAVKLVLPSSEGASEIASQRFLREAKAVARLTHPAIVTLFDFGVESDGTAFMVLELVRGRTLSSALRAGQVPRSQVIDVALEVLEALATAHREGLVHRDLKPENIMLLDDTSGRHTIKVLDFGLAKLAGGGTTGPQLTKTGMVFGTPQYMAPEQALGEEADERTDIYALGVILFQGLAGRLPYDADNPLILLQSHVAAPIPELPDDVGAGLAAVVYRAMAKEKADRFADAVAMAAALEAARGEAAGGVVGAAAAPRPTVVQSEAEVATIDSPLAAVASRSVVGETDADISGEIPTQASGPRVSPVPPPLPPPVAVVGGAGAGAVSGRPVAPPPPPPPRVDEEKPPSILTLGDAAGEVRGPKPAGRAARSRRRLIVAGSVAAAALVGIVSLAVMSGSDEPGDDAAAPEPAAVAPAVPPVEVAEEATAPTAPTTVRIESTPSGAHVSLDDEQVGTTPVTLTPDGKLGDRVEYSVRSKGRKSQSLQVVLDGKEQAHRVELPRGTSRKTRKPKASAEVTPQPAARPQPWPLPEPARPSPRPAPTPRPEPAPKKLDIPTRSLR